MEYFLHLDDERKGPYTLRQVQSMWHTGRLTGETLYWKEGFTEWVPLESILRVLEPPRGTEQTQKNADSGPAVQAMLVEVLRIVLPFCLGAAALAAYQALAGGRSVPAGHPASQVASAASAASPTPATPDTSPGFDGMAETLFHEYKSNEVASDRRYSGKPAMVTGMVSDLGIDVLGQPFLVVGGTGPLDGVQCIFSRTDAAVGNVPKGSFVTVRGKVKGRATRVLVENCTLQ